MTFYAELLARRGDAMATRKMIKIKLLPEEQKLLLKYGYPFEPEKRQLQKLIAAEPNRHALDLAVLPRAIDRRPLLRDQQMHDGTSPGPVGRTVRPAGIHRTHGRRHAGPPLTRKSRATAPRLSTAWAILARRTPSRRQFCTAHECHNLRRFRRPVDYWPESGESGKIS